MFLLINLTRKSTNSRYALSVQMRSPDGTKMKQILLILLCSTYVCGVHSTQQANRILDVLQSYLLIVALVIIVILIAIVIAIIIGVIIVALTGNLKLFNFCRSIQRQRSRISQLESTSQQHEVPFRSTGLKNYTPL
ncbi:unnamed protein product, partial [Mesorhabditis belari]|uniref:Uncharacterized protein n=1 Tax=Mesorhabditis belari TaxID=2138241 RepID=A0AAF3EY07_9BILA